MEKCDKILDVEEKKRCGMELEEWRAVGNWRCRGIGGIRIKRGEGILWGLGA
jgi:hypothetical protein